jgi:hypothetical protein
MTFVCTDFSKLEHNKRLGRRLIENRERNFTSSSLAGSQKLTELQNRTTDAVGQGKKGPLSLSVSDYYF